MKQKGVDEHPGTKFEIIDFKLEDIDFIEGCRIIDDNGIFVVLKNSSAVSTF